MADDQDLRVLSRTIKELTGIDISYYKPTQLRRRLGNMMLRNKASTFSEFANVLRSDESALRHFVDKFTINVSELFRNPEKFEQLQKRFLAPLLERFGRLRVWSAGCSIGAEVYSVVMQVATLDPKGRHRFLATDLDEQVLVHARRGEYGPSDVRHVPADCMRRFIEAENEVYRVSDDVRARVEFKRHDLLQDRFERGFHLILCRNVVIYFNDEAKAMLYRRFYDSLVPGGTLFVGGTERIPDAREIGFVSTTPFFYSRPEETRGGGPAHMRDRGRVVAGRGA